jgi:hypothetical protein
LFIDCCCNLKFSCWSTINIIFLATIILFLETMPAARLQKGSEEAKRRMAELRGMRKKKGGAPASTDQPSGATAAEPKPKRKRVQTKVDLEMQPL